MSSPITFASYSMFTDYDHKELGSDFFDEFLTFDDDHKGYTGTSQLESPKNSRSRHASLNNNDDETRYDRLWQSELGTVAQDHFYTERSGRAAISDSELLSLESIRLDSPNKFPETPISLPSSPTPTTAALLGRKTRVSMSFSKSLKKNNEQSRQGPHEPYSKTRSFP